MTPAVDPDLTGGPNFFIVGAAKAGTSALHDCLGRHPQVFMSQPKEPNFFADDLGHLVRRVASLESYLALFEGGRGMAVRGEASGAYLVSERAASNIRRFSPDARILISLRSPVSAFVSYHAESRRLGVERHAHVRHAALDLLRPPARSARSAERQPRYERALRYADQVERYFEAFPRDQVLVIIYEEWTQAPEPALRSVMRFIGVDSEIVPTLKQVRPSMRFRSRQVQRLVTTPPRWLRPAAETRTGRRLRSLAMRANVDQRPAPPLDDGLRAELGQFFHPDVERLGHLLGRDLSTVWGVARDRKPQDRGC